MEVQELPVEAPSQLLYHPSVLRNAEMCGLFDLEFFYSLPDNLRISGIRADDQEPHVPNFLQSTTDMQCSQLAAERLRSRPCRRQVKNSRTHRNHFTLCGEPHFARDTVCARLRLAESLSVWLSRG